jgi:hypothetical protein
MRGVRRGEEGCEEGGERREGEKGEREGGRAAPLGSSRC